MAKKALPTQDRLRAVIDEVKSQTDRGTAVVAAALLEELLQHAVLDRLIELSSERREALFDRNGAPLSTFSAKIEMSFALGVINNDARLALHVIRDIRNIFAHSIDPISFDDPEVASIIDNRSSKGVKAMADNRRNKFINSFGAIAVVLFSTLAADTRIKPLEETHRTHFLEMYRHGQEVAAAVIREALANNTHSQ